MLDIDVEDETETVKTSVCKKVWCPSRISLNSSFWAQPTIYMITATYYRRTQAADITRIANTLRSVPNLVWVLIEDDYNLTQPIQRILNESCVHFVYLKSMQSIDLNDSIHKGNVARQKGIDWVIEHGRQNGVVYIGDDDNTYDLHLFDMIRRVKRVGIWPVALVQGGIIELPKVKDGKIVGWISSNDIIRKYNVDMAGFAINLSWMRQFPRLIVDVCELGDIESCIINQMRVPVNELEVYGVQERRAYVWHTKTWSWPSSGRDDLFIV